MMKRTLIRTIGATCCIFALALGAQAATVNQLSSAGGANGWMDPAKWSNTAAPSSANDYYNSGLEIRNPYAANGPAAFAGNSLVITNGGRLKMHGNQDPIISNLTIAAGCEMRTVGSRQLNGNSLAVTGSGTLTVDVESNRRLTINSEMTVAASVSSIRIHASQLHPMTPPTLGGLYLTDPDNTFSGTWDVEEGYLKGVGFGSGSFIVGNTGYLDFDAGFTNVQGALVVENSGSGGIVLLDQDVKVGGATIWGEELAGGVYTGAELKAHGVYGSAFDAASSDTATLTIELQPSLEYVTTVQVRDDTADTFELSVYPGKASYDSTGVGGATGTIGDGTVVDYAFYNNSSVTASNGGWFLTTYARGTAGLISDVIAKYESGAGASGLAEIWTTTDPGVGFSSTPDYASSFNTWGYVSHLTNTINISKYQSGTVYMLFGSFADATTNTLTMSGPGQPDLTTTHVVSSYTGNDYHMSSFDFAQAEAYDTITAVYRNGDLDTSPASRARYMGIIFDGELSPPKGTTIAIK